MSKSKTKMPPETWSIPPPRPDLSGPDGTPLAAMPATAPPKRVEGTSPDGAGYPYSSVVYIETLIGNEWWQGSGVLLSPDEVLTASHVVWTAGVGAASRIDVAPAYDAGLLPYGSTSVDYFHFFPVDDSNGTISLASSQQDYAILHLRTRFDAGAMGYSANFAGGPVHVTGYPADAGGAMADLTETVVRDPDYTLLDGADTGEGSSGSPLWVDSNGVPYVVGLVSSGDGAIGYNLQITTPIFDQIGQWLAQDDFADPLVDTSYYLANNPDVAAAPVNPAYHYETQGWREGRNPNPYFSDSGYLAFNKDVAAAGLNPLDHFDAYGWREGRDPGENFDTGLYLLYNPDVARAGMDPLLHYMEYGLGEGRHAFLAIGPATALVGDFDPEFYLLAYPDVARSGVDPWYHFANWGWREDRNPNAYFDTRGYLAANPDVQRADLNPLVHYEDYGWREGRSPSGVFNTNAYLAAYPDVAAAEIDPLRHFLAFGALEGRQPFGDGQFF